MKLSTLEYFITLSESKSINEAARKLFISQPSLTKALKLLEDEIGTQLFQRSSAGIVLTPAGKKMLPEAKQVVEYYRGWKLLSQENILEEIDIFSYFSFPDFLFPDILLDFRKTHPNLTINYTTTTEPGNCISRSTRHPAIALAVCSENDYNRLCKAQGNEPLVLMDGEYRCLVNKHCPLSGKPYVTIEDLRGYYLMAPNMENCANSGFISGILQDIAAATPSNKMICVETATNVISIVNRNPEAYALSYYPALKRYTAKNLVDIPIKDTRTKGKICVFYSKEAYNQHPAMQELIHAIRDAATQFLSSLI